ncbi:hypothetical protein ACDL92_09075 [Ihubacter sp. mB4P-1]|uniref:glutamine amidotransferase-related protein n=1 Tax=Ihubacter sp. mB4P-1 TaxID=3242370 RepID=UPI00137B69BB
MMREGVIVIVDLGHENCQMIKEDVESMGVKAVICNHDADQAQLEALGEIKGFILNGGPCKKVNGFRVDASEAIYDNKIPTYSVDHAGLKGVDLYAWPVDIVERREKIRGFLTRSCNLEI